MQCADCKTEIGVGDLHVLVKYLNGAYFAMCPKCFWKEVYDGWEHPRYSSATRIGCSTGGRREVAGRNHCATTPKRVN